MTSFSWLSALALIVSAFFASSQGDFSIDDYNSKLPSWGVSWKAGPGAINGYYPTFYTGFAIRSEVPERIHIRVSRGNQTRVSVILDEQTLMDYVYDLKKRRDFYLEALKGSGGKSLVEKAPSATPQVDYFVQVVDSPKYGILQTASQSHNEIELYKKSLEVLKALNPERVYELNIDLNTEFGNWKKMVLNGELSNKGEQEVIKALNSLVWGRVNLTSEPSSEMLSLLDQAIELAKGSDNESFNQVALALFKASTGDKYNFKVLNGDGSWGSPIQCSSSESCRLIYPEFTTIYPTGSHKSFVSDGLGNKIPQFATPGLWNFIDRSYHEVDHIRNEPYYGWAPKMDYEDIGNGFHNPAVRFNNISKSVKSALGIDPSHTTLWSVKRGGVSSGCLRLPLGHVWEMRHILPVENEKMKQVLYFGSMSQDFDVFDINGDGQKEVMGVEYLISYGLQGEGGLAKREGSNLEIATEGKLDFYTRLYGSRGVFEAETVSSQGKEKLSLVFNNPSISHPSYLDLRKKKVVTRMEVLGRYPLYEQSYERDKVQFYIAATMSGLNSDRRGLAKQIVRLMGRVKGCAPNANKETCGESAFDQEASRVMKAAL